MSLFVRLSCNFFTHRKTIRLRTILGDDAFWLPPRLWAYAAEHQPDGNFADYTENEIAEALGYRSDPKKLVSALHESGFMDSDQRIHNWKKHNAYHETFAARARKAGLARWQKERTKEKERVGIDTDKRERGEEQALLEHCSRSASSSAQVMLEASTQSHGSEVLAFEQVKMMVMTIGIPDDFVHWVYDDWFGRNGKDAAGCEVGIVEYLKKRWAREQTDWRAGTHKGNSKHSHNGKHDHRAERRAREYPQEIHAKRLL